MTFAPSRRRLLQGAAVFALLPAGCRAPGLRDDPFTLGVASGYPQPDGVVLWTRLAPQPLLPDGGMSRGDVPVRWEIARDDGFRDILHRGLAVAAAEWAHAVRVEPRGLPADTPLFYRFMAGDAVSPTGRTRTAPLPGTMSTKLRFAYASCQNYEQGFYAAWRHLVADDPDLIVFLGDYIYERSWGQSLVRSHGAGEARDLAGYRQRYALYRSDPLLQAAHAHCPWLVIWDDHEVANDYAGERDERLTDPAIFRRRRAAAYRAWYEHMPVPARLQPQGDALPLHTHHDHGALLRIFLLDDRQYRTAQACPAPGRAGANVVAADCAELHAPGRTLLGQAQEQWLERTLNASAGRWNLLAQQSILNPWRRNAAGHVWTDAWDGYPDARRRLTGLLADRRIANPVFIGGDIHAFVAADVHADPADPRTPIVASEVVGTSITSQGWDAARWARSRRDNPHFRFADGGNGYVVADLAANGLDLRLRRIGDRRQADTGVATAARFRIEAGRSGLQSA